MATMTQKKWVLAENFLVCSCGRLDTEITISVKDYYNVMKKFIVISNVIRYQPVCWPIYYPNMVQLSITISLGFFIDQDYIFLPIFLRLDLDFADLVSSNMDVGTGESSKLKTFLTFRALFVS